MRPDADTLLLRACLWQDDAARDAFTKWAQRPAQALESLQQGAGLKRRLLPLLQDAAGRHRLRVPPELQPPLRAAGMYEQLRTGAYQEIAAKTLASLQAAGQPFLATRGVVFSASLYGDAGLRHCHDIDLLVRDEDQKSLADRLVRECGFAHREQTGAPSGSLLLYHASGLPLFLHTRPLASPAFQVPVSVETPTPLHMYGMDVPSLPPTVALLHLLLHGPLTPNGESLVWLCDAYRLLQRSTTDWNAFQAGITGDAELLVVRTCLRYLAWELQAPVPGAVLDELDRRWARLADAKRSAAEELLMLVLLQKGVVGKRDFLHAAHGMAGVLRTLRTLLVPSPQALQKTGSIEERRQAPAFWTRQMISLLRRPADKHKHTAG